MSDVTEGNRQGLSLIHISSSSKAAMRKRGMRLAVTGTSSDSMEMDARFEMRIVAVSYTHLRRRRYR